MIASLLMTSAAWACPSCPVGIAGWAAIRSGRKDTTPRGGFVPAPASA